jgi:hypothetical protein
VAHHHRRKAKDIPNLWRSYSTGIGAYRMKLVLSSDTRSAFLRAWYWSLLRTLKGRIPVRMLFWEVQGAVRYLALRLQRRLAGATRVDSGTPL